MMSLLTGALGFLSSSIGRVLLAFAIGWLWNGYRVNASWQARVAAEKAVAEAAYRAEVARQEQAAREIAEAATRRVEEDADLERELRRQIADAEKSEKPHETVRIIKGQSRVVTLPCGVDRDLVDRLHKLDAAARKGSPARGPRDLR